MTKKMEVLIIFFGGVFITVTFIAFGVYLFNHANFLGSLKKYRNSGVFRIVEHFEDIWMLIVPFGLSFDNFSESWLKQDSNKKDFFNRLNKRNFSGKVFTILLTLSFLFMFFFHEYFPNK